MKLRLKLAAYTALLLLANGVLVSCKDEPSTPETQSSDTANMPAAQSIGTLEGTIGKTTFSRTLNTQNSSIVIEEWDGISDKKQQRNSDDMSFEAFLLGTDRWNGPPRMVTITHHVEDITLSLRFAGRLAIDEKLTALPGCLIETTDAPLVPAAKGSWETAKNVTLPRYDLILQITSFDESSNLITGIIKGQLIDPTKPGSTPSPIELTLTSTTPPASVEESAAPEEPELRIPANHLIIDPVTPAEPGETDSTEDEQGEDRPTTDPPTAPAEVNPIEEDDVEIRPAVPFTPQDDTSNPDNSERRGF